MEDHRVYLLLGLERDKVFDCLVGTEGPHTTAQDRESLKIFCVVRDSNWIRRTGAAVVQASLKNKLTPSLSITRS